MDVLDAALERLIVDECNNVPADELRARLARLRGTPAEAILEQDVARFIVGMSVVLRWFATEPDPGALEHGRVVST